MRTSEIRRAFLLEFNCTLSYISDLYMQHTAIFFKYISLVLINFKKPLFYYHWINSGFFFLYCNMCKLKHLMYRYCVMKCACPFFMLNRLLYLISKMYVYFCLHSFRVMTYNILADVFADSEFTRTELYPYCAPYALSIDYRKQLLMKEILGKINSLSTI